MAEVKWIKIVTDIFDDEKMLLIESLPSADSLIVIWFKLLCLAGKNNNDGVFLMNDRIPYTEEMLSTIFRRDINTVRLALSTFEQFGMIEIINGVITIPNWGKHQTLDSYEKKKERDKLYQAERRAKQKQLTEKSSDKSSDTSSDKSSDVAISDIDKDIEEDIEEEKNNDVSSLRSDTLSVRTDIDRVVAIWNELDGMGDIKGIRGIGERGDRKRLTLARLKEYGIEGFQTAIERIKESDFLQGKHKGNPWVITFDWLIKPNNFPKVIEGNYDNKVSGEQQGKDWWKQ